MLNHRLYCDVETTLKLRYEVNVIQSTIIKRRIDVNKVMLNHHYICIVTLKQGWDYVVMLTSSNQI